MISKSPVMEKIDTYELVIVVSGGDVEVGTVTIPCEVVEDAYQDPARGRDPGWRRQEFRTWDRMKPARMKGDKAMWRLMTRADDVEANRRQSMFEIETWVRETYGDDAWDGREGD